MKNIWKIFSADARNIRKNVIAMIVVLGLSVVPCLYAWFNIAASWDPYSNTGNLKVAVATEDAGYKSELIPITMNFGDTILSTLRTNRQLDWRFVSPERAIEGVKSGDYYAAIVIPESFSRDMMSLFSSHTEKASLRYYLNEKENAIAPKITDKGSSAVRRQVDQIFAETITQAGIDLLDTVSAIADRGDVRSIASALTENVERAARDLNAASSTVTAFSNMTGSIQKTLDTTSEFLKQSGEHTEENLDTLESARDSAASLSKAFSSSANTVKTVLSQGKTCYEAVSKEIDSAFSSASKDTASISDSLGGLETEVQSIIDRYTGVRNSLQDLTKSVPETAELLGPIIGGLNESIVSQEAVRDKLKDTQKKIGTAGKNSAAYRKELKKLAAQSSREFSALQSDYHQDIQKQIRKLFGTLGDTSDSAVNLLKKMDSGITGLSETTGTAVSDLGELKAALDTSAALLDESSSHVESMLRQMRHAAKSGDVGALQEILGKDPETVSAFLAAPVQLETNKLYPVENYGSAMAPFYSTLAIWVGGIVLAAMLKVAVSRRARKKLTDLKNYQLYFGRQLIFLLIGLIQSTLICLGDLYYLGIQCEHPFYFLLAGWISSIVYVNIIYTLTISFGDIGKAVSVILLVIQVAGSGGTFPIEVAPGFFQAVYPLLPFTHSMAAMRECIAGFYQNTYWMELGFLLLFLVPSLLLGLVLRKPVIRLNDRFMEKLESTKLM